jgi:hypothetical protein
LLSHILGAHDRFRSSHTVLPTSVKVSKHRQCVHLCLVCLARLWTQVRKRVWFRQYLHISHARFARNTAMVSREHRFQPFSYDLETIHSHTCQLCFSAVAEEQARHANVALPKHPKQNNPCQKHISLSKHTSLHSAFRFRFPHCLPLPMCRLQPSPPHPLPTYTPFPYHQRKLTCTNLLFFCRRFWVRTTASGLPTRQWLMKM